MKHNPFTMKRTRRPPKGQTKTFQALPEDVRIIDELRLKLEPQQGRVTDTSLFRMGLRALAQANGVNLVQQ